MSRGSAQHPAQHPDDYPTERPASRQADYASQQYPGWGRDERATWGRGEPPAARRADYPTQDRAWSGDKPSTAGRADYPTQQYPGWGRDERHNWGPGEPPAARRADYPSQQYPGWGREERPSWGRDEPSAAGRAEYPTQEFPGWGGDEWPSRGRDERPALGWGERPNWGPEGRSSWGRDERRADYPTQDRAQDGDEYPTQDRAWGGDERPTDDAREEDGQPASDPAQRPAWRKAGYRQPVEPETSQPTGPARSTSHRKPSFVGSALRRRAVWMTAAVVLAAAAGLVVGQKTHWPDLTSQPAALNRATAPNHAAAPSEPGSHGVAAPSGRASATGSRLRRDTRTGTGVDRRSARRRAARHRSDRRKHGILADYGNPVRRISGLLAERIDMGVDFGGSGPIYAIGPGVVVSAITGDGGWPGGGWMSYRLTAGPAAGLMVFVAEDITPTVTVGQKVTSKTVIANMFNGGAGIETGWAQSNGVSPESQAPEAGAIWGQGPFPTAIGMNFEELLQALGVPAGYGRDQSTFGTVPAGYPTSW